MGSGAKRRLTAQIKDSLRELSTQLSLLNQQVGARVELRPVDFECLDLINRYGPLSPTALARRAGLHPATLTGILDRLQRGGWITRERDPDASDRRAITLRARRDRNAEIYRLYGPMNASLDEICDTYTEAELQVLADFLSRTHTAAHTATTPQDPSPPDPAAPRESDTPD
ncbi:MarR family winged helix-turn-helix transcriptional regulator [Nonomuraea sp. NPDC050536]|uniref:MarR family winged helix-turn-helix transcriptional regulator n=1 Tax=Nonomuraea sp. NPDC050536 TaxID=3364366 RepID=UPI0037CB93E4